MCGVGSLWAHASADVPCSERLVWPELLCGRWMSDTCPVEDQTCNIMCRQQIVNSLGFRAVPSDFWPLQMSAPALTPFYLIPLCARSGNSEEVKGIFPPSLFLLFFPIPSSSVLRFLGISVDNLCKTWCYTHVNNNKEETRGFLRLRR